MSTSSNKNIIKVDSYLHEIRSDEIQEFISNKPHFFIRWGTLLFFLILLLMTVLCWFIKYPDIVVCKASLTSINSPKEVISRTDGKLIELNYDNSAVVKKGELLACMESIANYKSVTKTKTQLKNLLEKVTNNESYEIVNFFPNNFNKTHLTELGELQEGFQVFMQTFISYKDYVQNGFYLKKRKLLQDDVENIVRLNTVLKEQKSLLEKDLNLSKTTFSSNEKLANEKVISTLDFRNEESKLLSKELTLPQINTSIINNETQQNDKKKEILELENQIINQKNIFIQSLQSILTQIDQWEFKFLLKAPISGKVQMTAFYQKNQYIKNGQTIFYIQPKDEQSFAEVTIPQYNFGKVKVGQDVLLKFLAYPSEQFGSVLGKIKYISQTPTDSGYIAKIELQNGLTTNYGRQLPYQFGLIAQANIITENLRLLDRFYYNIRQQLSR